MAKSMEEIAVFLENVKFKKKLFGISEEAVWRKLEQLQKEYSELLEIQRIQYEAVLQDKRREIAHIRQMQNEPKPLKPSETSFAAQNLKPDAKQPEQKAALKPSKQETASNPQPNKEIVLPQQAKRENISLPPKAYIAPAHQKPSATAPLRQRQNADDLARKLNMTAFSASEIIVGDAHA